MNTIVVLSWLFIGLIVYVYVGYPVLIAVWGTPLTQSLGLMLCLRRSPS